jgi:farnesyl-diphosphate farnesyltransferase
MSAMMNNAQLPQPLSSPETRTAVDGWAVLPAGNSCSTMITSKQLLGDLLKATSRSFYLTLRVLPTRVRPQIGLAYLLARTADTIADTEIVPLDERLAALQKLRERILGQSSAPLNFDRFARQQGAASEQLLLERVEDSLLALQYLSADDQTLLRDVLTTITSGQELDLRRFGKASLEHIFALETDAELDDYTYRVAGCVGEFWTKICRAHLFPHAPLDEKQFIADGIRFGKGLQLVNILRDLPEDYRHGRCYLPMEKLETAGLLPQTLLTPASQTKFLPLYGCYLDQAESHLRAGWNYTNTLPFSQFRVRLACAWPILIGAKTIERLRAANVDQLLQHVKVSRGEIRGMMAGSLLASPFPFWWRKLFSPTAKAVAAGGNLT